MSSEAVYINNKQRIYVRMIQRLNIRCNDDIKYCKEVCTNRNYRDYLSQITKKEIEFPHSCITFTEQVRVKYKDKFYFHTLEEALIYYSKAPFTLYISWMGELMLYTEGRWFGILTLNSTGEIAYRALLNKGHSSKYIIRELMTTREFVSHGNDMLGYDVSDMTSLDRLGNPKDGRFGTSYRLSFLPSIQTPHPPNEWRFKKGWRKNSKV